MNADLTRDAFLGGRLQIWQPAAGYRAGIDAVLLAAACSANPGQSVLELGSGVGTAILCLGARVPGLDAVAVERDPETADLARRNAEANAQRIAVVTADLAALPGEVRQRRFDHVIANPPYFRRDTSAASADPRREAARGEETPLDVWIEVASRRLAPRGWLTVIQRAERLGDLLASVQSRLGHISVQPLAPRQGRPARLVVLRAQKGGRGHLTLHAPLDLHVGPRHSADRDSYTPQISDVLRAANQLPGFEV